MVQKVFVVFSVVIIEFNISFPCTRDHIGQIVVFQNELDQLVANETDRLPLFPIIPVKTVVDDKMCLEILYIL